MTRSVLDSRVTTRCSESPACPLTQWKHSASVLPLGLLPDQLSHLSYAHPRFRFFAAGW